jgi:hypothetical protein
VDTQLSKNLKLFYSEFLNANTWAQRKDGVPLELLDNLSVEELKIAESELINIVSINDSWPILGLGHIKSSASLPKLYELLANGSNHILIILAHAIFSICRDEKMIEIAIQETNQLVKKLPKTEFELIDVIFWLPDFLDERIGRILSDLCDNSSYLIAYNAARALGRSTEDIVRKFTRNSIFN